MSLLACNCVSHILALDRPNTDYDVNVVYVPENTTNSFFQPRNQKIVTKFKTLFHHRTLREILDFLRTDLLKKASDDILPFNNYFSWERFLNNVVKKETIKQETEVERVSNIFSITGIKEIIATIIQ